MKRCICTLFLAAAAVLTASPAEAWHGKGHAKVARAAALSLPDSAPAFLREGAGAIAVHSIEPDTLTRPIAPPALHAATSSDHYFDMELVEGVELPADRYAFIAMCQKKGLAPDKVGLLPYAIQEATGRLAVALAEHRRWPDDKDIQAKALLYAGLLTHLAADACQPLHTTIHFDGRVGPDGKRTGKGIHLKVDALIQKLPVTPEKLAQQAKIDKIDDLPKAIAAQIAASHGQVDRVYELAEAIPAADAALPADADAVREFAAERMQSAVDFSASLFMAAWRMSEKIELPDWHVEVREAIAAETRNPAARSQDSASVSESEPATSEAATRPASGMPETSGQSSKGTLRVLVTMTGFVVNGESYDDADELLKALRAAREAYVGVVVVPGGKDVEWKRVTEAVSAAVGAGYEKIGLAQGSAE
jgi:biopolymer transport protein ExbD